MISGEIEVNQLDKIHFIFEQKQNLRTTLKKLEKNSLKQAEKQKLQFQNYNKLSLLFRASLLLQGFYS